MSIEIWEGVCNSFGGDTQYETAVTAYRERGKVSFWQEGDFLDGAQAIVCDESEAIDIALCILKELVPGFMQNEADLVKELARYKAAYGHLESELRMLPKEE